MRGREKGEGRREVRVVREERGEKREYKSGIGV